MKRSNLLDSRSLPPEGGSHPERFIQTLGMTAIGLPAALVPASGAARVDPVTALRSEDNAAKIV